MSDLGNRIIFAKNLKHYMDIYKVDRNQLCTALGFKYTTVSEWLAGNKYPRIDKIEMLANYFNVQKSDLIEDKHGYGYSDIGRFAMSSTPESMPLETWTVYNYEGEGTHTINIKPETIDKLRKLLQVAGDLPPEKIDSLINVAENMK